MDEFYGEGEESEAEEDQEMDDKSETMSKRDDLPDKSHKTSV